MRYHQRWERSASRSSSQRSAAALSTRIEMFNCEEGHPNVVEPGQAAAHYTYQLLGGSEWEAQHDLSAAPVGTIKPKRTYR